MPRVSDSVRAYARPRGSTTSEEKTARVEVPAGSVIEEIKMSGEVLAKGESDQVGIVSSVSSEFLNLQVKQYSEEGVSTDSDTVRMTPGKRTSNGRTIEATAKVRTDLQTQSNWYNKGSAEVRIEVKYRLIEDSEESQDSDQGDSSEDGSQEGQESSSDSGRKAQMVLAGGILLGGVLLWRQ